MFDFSDETERATAAWLASHPEVAKVREAARACVGIAIPQWLLKQTSGKCVHCGYDTEDRDEGDWLHDECRDELIAEQREDNRLDDPRHVPYSNLGRR